MAKKKMLRKIKLGNTNTFKLPKESQVGQAVSDFKNNFYLLEEVYPSSAKAFSVAFRYKTGKLLENADKNHFDALIELIVSHCKAYGVSFERMSKDSEGWIVDMQESPIIDGDIKRVGIIDGNFWQTAFAALTTTFRQMKCETL